jgi:HEPN domain-containing protein
MIVPRRIDDWLRQADKDLKHAKTSLSARDYEWACFASQQAAEKAIHDSGAIISYAKSKILRQK